MVGGNDNSNDLILKTFSIKKFPHLHEGIFKIEISEPAMGHSSLYVDGFPITDTHCHAQS